MTKTNGAYNEKLLTPAIVATGLVAFVSAAQARSAYDGSWGLSS
jgi:hypothetical protein